jgi:hypothetical protein
MTLFLGYLFQTHIPRAGEDKKSLSQLCVGAVHFDIWLTLVAQDFTIRIQV